MKRLLGALLFALTALPATALADQCYDYNNYGSNAYYYCVNDGSCRWNGNYCESIAQSQQCDWIRDYRQCVNAGCDWDNRYGCFESQAPQYCEDVRDYRECLNYGCYWDNRIGCNSNPGGGGGRQVWQCTAQDNGWEEHWGGHASQGNTQWAAQQAALNACQQIHGTCYVTECQQIR